MLKSIEQQAELTVAENNAMQARRIAEGEATEKRQEASTKARIVKMKETLDSTQKKGGLQGLSPQEYLDVVVPKCRNCKENLLRCVCDGSKLAK